MALTLKVELKLQDTGLTGLYNLHQVTWLGLAKRSYAFVQDNFPNGSLIRRDDVAEALVPVLEVHDLLRHFLATKKLRQRYWHRWFCDLILDRVWDSLTEGE